MRQQNVQVNLPSHALATQLAPRDIGFWSGTRGTAWDIARCRRFVVKLFSPLLGRARGMRDLHALLSLPHARTPRMLICECADDNTVLVQETLTIRDDMDMQSILPGVAFEWGMDRHGVPRIFDTENLDGPNGAMWGDR